MTEPLPTLSGISWPRRVICVQRTVASPLITKHIDYGRQGVSSGCFRCWPDVTLPGAHGEKYIPRLSLRGQLDWTESCCVATRSPMVGGD